MNISAIFWKGQHCIAAPAATNCLLFENVLEKKSLSGVCFFFPKEEHEQRGNTHLCFFSQPQKISNLFCDSYHTRWVCPEACVCSCVSLICSSPVTIPVWLFNMLPLHLTGSASARNQFSLTPHRRSHSKLQILRCQIAQLSIMWQPLASQTVIGWCTQGAPSFTLCCEYLNRRYGCDMVICLH